MGDFFSKIKCIFLTHRGIFFSVNQIFLLKTSFLLILFLICDFYLFFPQSSKMSFRKQSSSSASMKKRQSTISQQKQEKAINFQEVCKAVYISELNNLNEEISSGEELMQCKQGLLLTVEVIFETFGRNSPVEFS